MDGGDQRRARSAALLHILCKTVLIGHNETPTGGARLKKRTRRLIWLNPLAGWDNYQPVARGMAEALPHIDLFRPANTLAGFAALEPKLARL